MIEGALIMLAMPVLIWGVPEAWIPIVLITALAIVWFRSERIDNFFRELIEPLFKDKK